eukprot:185302-Pyramimonas_sp.AAC.1
MWFSPWRRAHSSYSITAVTQVTAVPIQNVAIAKAPHTVVAKCCSRFRDGGHVALEMWCSA